ncbi:MAG: hypothetical protein WCI67_00085 [Chloroflexales bacterium]
MDYDYSPLMKKFLKVSALPPSSVCSFSVKNDSHSNTSILIISSNPEKLAWESFYRLALSVYEAGWHVHGVFSSEYGIIKYRVDHAIECIGNIKDRVGHVVKAPVHLVFAGDWKKDRRFGVDHALLKIQVNRGNKKEDYVSFLPELLKEFSQHKRTLYFLMPDFSVSVRDVYVNEIINTYHKEDAFLKDLPVIGKELRDLACKSITEVAHIFTLPAEGDDSNLRKTFDYCRGILLERHRFDNINELLKTSERKLVVWFCALQVFFLESKKSVDDCLIVLSVLKNDDDWKHYCDGSNFVPLQMRNALEKLLLSGNDTLSKETILKYDWENISSHYDEEDHWRKRFFVIAHDYKKDLEDLRILRDEAGTIVSVSNKNTDLVHSLESKEEEIKKIQEESDSSKLKLQSEQEKARELEEKNIDLVHSLESKEEEIKKIQGKNDLLQKINSRYAFFVALIILWIILWIGFLR